MCSDVYHTSSTSVPYIQYCRGVYVYYIPPHYLYHEHGVATMYHYTTTMDIMECASAAYNIIMRMYKYSITLLLLLLVDMQGVYRV